MADASTEIDRKPSRVRSLERFAFALPWLCVALPGVTYALSATRGAVASGLGRDQGIFQYVGWAWSRGEVGYRDVRDVNGPLTPLVHLALQAFGGGDEGRFRALDLAITGFTYAASGALLAAAASARRSPAERALAAALGACAAWVALSAQYLTYIFWDLAQRESFMDWFLLPSLALAIWALAPERARRHALAGLAGAGALSAVTWLGKPTYGLFFALQIAAAGLTEGALRERARRAGALALGAAGGLALGALVASRWSDLGAYARIAAHDVPAMYRFIWPRTAADVVGLRIPELALAVATSALCAVLVWRKRLPRAVAVLSLSPLAALASCVLQKKGFPYHFHPMTATLVLAWLAVVAHAIGGARERAWRLVAIALAGALGFWAARALRESPHAGLGDLARGSPEHRARFGNFDYFPAELEAAARYLDASTPPDARAQHYGMDPYVLFLARRRSATPYIYAYDLNCDAAQAGSADPEGLHPTAAEVERIREMCNLHAQDMLARLERSPPAAFVLADDSPLFTYPDAERDLEAHAPKVHAFLAERYVLSARFGHVAVWLERNRNVTEPAPKIR